MLFRSGSFASVHLAVDGCRSSYRQVACKIIKKKKDIKLEKMMKEVRILTGLNHVCSLDVRMPTVVLTSRDLRPISTGHTGCITMTTFCTHIVTLVCVVTDGASGISSSSCVQAETFSPTSSITKIQKHDCTRAKRSTSCIN